MGTKAPSGEVSVSLGSSPDSLAMSLWMVRPNEMKSWPVPAGSAHAHSAVSGGRGCVPKRGSGSQAPARPPRVPRPSAIWMLPPMMVAPPAAGRAAAASAW
jgi:hypothetical protein